MFPVGVRLEVGRSPCREKPGEFACFLRIEGTPRPADAFSGGCWPCVCPGVLLPIRCPLAQPPRCLPEDPLAGERLYPTAKCIRRTGNGTQAAPSSALSKKGTPAWKTTASSGWRRGRLARELRRIEPAVNVTAEFISDKTLFLSGMKGLKEEMIYKK